MSENLIRYIIKRSIDERGNVIITDMRRIWRAAQIDKRYKLFFWLHRALVDPQLYSFADKSGFLMSMHRAL